ncbi:hypothetical protein [Candidatus Clostridium radicumherbarum]|uniref:DUF4830 domain-containing protein n=1 Tax=Candidatus Clostridium radicumherbarum TaxID=3381662 RepID=A0ABW8TQQ2_9CLOT
MTDKGIKFKPLGVAIIVILVIIILYYTSINRITIDVSQVKSLKIQSLEKNINDGSWKWNEKEITRKEDIQKVVGFLNSIKYRKIMQENDNGFGLVVIIKGEKDYTVVFKGNVVNVNGTNYRTNLPNNEKAHQIYKDLDYTEKNATNLMK